jgi:hypothetical protein
MRKAVPESLSVSTGTVAGRVSTAPRKDGRRPLMVYLDPTLIKDLKKEALDRDINLYELVEELLKKPRA